MRPTVAVVELESLKAEALADSLGLRAGGRHAAWRSKVEAVLTRSLGARHHTTEGFRKVVYHYVGPQWAGMRKPDGDGIFVAGVQRACGYLEAAVYELRLLTDEDAPVDDRAFDPELWAHVQGLVAEEDWGKVAAQVAIFVEDRFRTWAGHPKDRNDEDLVGKGLYAAVLAGDSEYRLGRRKGEYEGWRMLGMGFAQAVGNVDRHRVQDRPDAHRYALGVLGLGSLLLTQLRHEHGDHLESG